MKEGAKIERGRHGEGQLLDNNLQVADVRVVADTDDADSHGRHEKYSWYFEHCL